MSVCTNFEEVFDLEVAHDVVRRVDHAAARTDMSRIAYVKFKYPNSLVNPDKIKPPGMISRSAYTKIKYAKYADSSVNPIKTICASSK